MDNYKDSLLISSSIFLSIGNNLVSCQKLPLDTPSYFQGKKFTVLKSQCWPSCYSFKLVWFLFPKLILKSSSYKNDSRSEVAKYHLRSMFSGGLITISFQNTLSNQLYSRLRFVFIRPWGVGGGWRL